MEGNSSNLQGEKQQQQQQTFFRPDPSFFDDVEHYSGYHGYFVDLAQIRVVIGVKYSLMTNLVRRKILHHEKGMLNSFIMLRCNM